MRFFLLVCLALFQWLAAATHVVEFNQRTRLQVVEGDQIELSKLPTGWPFNTVNFVADAVNGNVLDLGFSHQSESFAVQGYSFSDQFRLPAESVVITVTSGSATLDFTFWVSNYSWPPLPEDSEGSEDSTGTVDQEETEVGAPLAVNQETNLGAVNSSLIAQNTTGKYVIDQFPTWNYNVITVQIQPRDNRELNGKIRAGALRKDLTGYNTEMKFNRGSKVQFALEFPENRKVEIRWWASTEEVKLQDIASSVVSETAQEITLEYGFVGSELVKEDLRLTFDKGALVAGTRPTIKEANLLPANVPSNESYDKLVGPVYDVHAELEDGKSIQVALPIPALFKVAKIPAEYYYVNHFNSQTHTWEVIVPDRVDDNYVYFTMNSFSLVEVFVDGGKWLGGKIVDGKDWVSDVVVEGGKWVGGKFIEGAKYIGKESWEALKATARVADDFVDGIQDLYTALADGLCSLLDIDTYIAFWSDADLRIVPQGDLSLRLNASYSYKNTLLAQNLNILQTTPLQTCVAPETDAAGTAACWKDVFYPNAKLFLADIIQAQSDPNFQRRFVIENSDFTGEHFLVSAGMSANITDRYTGQVFKAHQVLRFTNRLLSATPRVLEVIEACDGALGLNDEFQMTYDRFKGLARAYVDMNAEGVCRNILAIPGDLWEWGTSDALDCATEALAFADYNDDTNFSSYLGGQRDDHLNYSGEYFNIMSQVAWLDRHFFDVFFHDMSGLRDQLHTYVGVVHESYRNNNIPIKALIGVSFWDLLVENDKRTYNLVKGWLEAQMGESGGYSEGTGYLQYINSDVPYILSSLVYSGLIHYTELPMKYLRSAEWLAQNSFPQGSGLVPIDLDDGNTHAVDFGVYGYLMGSNRYASLAESYPGDYNVMRFLGVPHQVLNADAPFVLGNSLQFSDGVGMLRAQSGADVYSFSMIAESGALRTLGRAHDQQDNFSIQGHSMVRGMLVDDGGYPGFSKRNEANLSRSNGHNTLVDASSSTGGVAPNGMITASDAIDILTGLPGVVNIKAVLNYNRAVSDLLVDFLIGDQLNMEWEAGGADPVTSPEPFVETISGTHLYGLRGLQVVGSRSHSRSLVRFGPKVLVVDRFDVQNANLQWMIPKMLWENEGGAPYSIHPANAGSFSNLRTYYGLGAYVDQDPIANAWATKDVWDFNYVVPTAESSIMTAFDLGQNLPVTEIPCGSEANCFEYIASEGTYRVVIPHLGATWSDPTGIFDAELSTDTPFYAFEKAGETQISLGGEEGTMVVDNQVIPQDQLEGGVVEIGNNGVRVVVEGIVVNQISTSIKSPVVHLPTLLL